MILQKYTAVYKGLPKSVYLLFISTIINKLGGFITPLMTLILTVKIGFSENYVGLFTTLALLSQAPFILFGGVLVDKYGGKKVLVTLHVLGAFIYILCGLMQPSFLVAILIVMASNVYAMASPAPNAIIPVVTPENMVKSAYSLLYLGLNLGLAIGPLIGGLLFNDHLNLLFILDAITTLLSAGLILLFFKEHDTIEHGSDQASDDEEAGVAQTETQEAKETNTFYTFLFKNPELLIFTIILLLYNFCYIQWNFMLPLQSVELFKENAAAYFSLLLSVNAITVVIFSPILTALTQKIHALQSMFLGGLFYIISFLFFAMSHTMLLFVGAIVIMTIGEILIAINSISYIATSTPKKFFGRANSLLFIVSGIGYAIGPVIMGNVIMYTSFKNAWFIVILLAVFAVTLMYLLGRSKRVLVSNADNLPDENDNKTT